MILLNLLKALNEEEELLEFEPSQFPELQDTIAFKEPYDKLWKTALGFATKHEQWMHGEVFLLSKINTKLNLFV